MSVRTNSIFYHSIECEYDFHENLLKYVAEAYFVAVILTGDYLIMYDCNVDLNASGHNLVL